jgi:cation transport ATPase
MTKAKVHIAHQAPGRVRMKIPAGKGNPELLQQVADTFRQIPGIEEVSINPTTGSVVLRYDVDRHEEFHDDFRQRYDRHAEPAAPATEIDTLARKIEDEAEFLAQNSASARAVVDFVKHVDHNIKSATNNNIDLKILFAGGIVAVTILEIGASAATPVWVTLSLFAVNHFIEMHPPHPKRAHPSAPVVVKGS